MKNQTDIKDIKENIHAILTFRGINFRRLF